MTDWKRFEIINLSPILINAGSGNYLRSADFIPASSILGAVMSRFIDSEKWGKEKEEVKLDIHMTDAYPTAKNQYELNPASLVTLYTENQENRSEIRDGIRNLVETIKGRYKWGVNKVRLKKGPRHWYIHGNKVCDLQIERVKTNVLKLDDKLKIAWKAERNGEVKGAIAHLDSIAPGILFAFEATGEDLDKLEDALKEGIFVGSMKSRGYGLIKLKQSESVKQKKEEELGNYTVLDFYGSVNYDYYLKVIDRYKDKILFKSVGVEKRKTLHYDKWVSDYVVKSGSVVVINDYYKDIYTLEEESIREAGSGKIVVNHRVHRL
ncbi:hypothetical protein CM19_13060 [Candidatus Acidianus copahuensis]|uniref:CRISPR type III-associated protein domain-containing protein n=1 Tax=Candidatus Acidianus copahuensis TaxID=1160895 RepID=A0A031LJ11_9CREN|nr:RAMP superfamily CRISPR-associated protein [Candidatus Acidianus copahuensis]EZQ01541.1 hypothetical protein CM19_13060 [Candidatus Acidianus copahuensis]